MFQRPLSLGPRPQQPEANCKRSLLCLGTTRETLSSFKTLIHNSADTEQCRKSWSALSFYGVIYASVNGCIRYVIITFSFPLYLVYDMCDYIYIMVEADIGLHKARNVEQSTRGF